MTYTRGEKIGAVLLGLAMGLSLLAVTVENFSRRNTEGAFGYEEPKDTSPVNDDEIDDEVDVSTLTAPSPVAPAAPRP